MASTKNLSTLVLREVFDAGGVVKIALLVVSEECCIVETVVIGIGSIFVTMSLLRLLEVDVACDT